MRRSGTSFWKPEKHMRMDVSAHRSVAQMSTARVNDCRLRPANPGEAGFLSALALRSKAHWGYSADFLRACEAELTYDAATIKSETFSFVVAEVARSIVGFYALERCSTVEFELHDLFVEPEYIGLGIGRALIEHAKQSAHARGGRSIAVQSDPYAEQFYRAAGGVRIGERASGSIPGRYLPLLTISLENMTVS